MPMDWDPDGEGADLKECMRTSLTGGTPIADLVGEERVSGHAILPYSTNDLYIVNSRKP
jgi:hypothetical protein